MHEVLIGNLGEETATTLMEHLPPVGWADVATKADLEHLRVAMKADLDRLRGDMDARFEAVNERFNALGDHFDAALAKSFSTQMRWVVGTMIAFFGIFGVLLSLWR